MSQSTSEEALKNMQVMINNFLRLENGKLLEDVDLRRYGFDSGELVSNITVQELCTIHPSARKIDLTFCKMVTDVGLWAIARHCVTLKELILHGCDKITNVGIRSISLRCVDLEMLNLNACYNMDDVCLTIIAGGVWHLKRLYLRDCDRISDTGIGRLAQGLGAFLKVLDLQGCPNVGEFGDRALREVGAHCIALEELYITDSKRVEDSGFIALAQGCINLRVLVLSGCENVSKKGFKPLCKAPQNLMRLRLLDCRKLSDNDFMLFNNSPLQTTLQSLEFNRFTKITDKGVGAICQALGATLLHLDLSCCKNLTDYSAMIIGNLCRPIRSVDLTHCGALTDETVHALARGCFYLTSLKLDGNPKVTTRALLLHADRELHFVEMAVQWLGYQPKASVEELIILKERHMEQTAKAVLIQSALRRKFATRIYWIRYRSRLIGHVIPLFQAIVRGVIQRKLFAQMLFRIKREKMATKIQSKYRKYYARQQRLMEVKRKRYLARRIELAILLQKVFRRIQGKKRADVKRAELANLRLERGKKQALHETRAITMQRAYRGFKGRQRVKQLAEERKQQLARRALEERCCRHIQRIAHGKIGRIRARRRRWEIAHAQMLWERARDLQRVYRGHAGRLRFKHFRKLFIELQRYNAATSVQRVYRGWRGRLLFAVAKAMRLLRAKQQHCALEMQRFLRGCMGRVRFTTHKEFVTRRRRQIAAATTIQRLYRGHKGREARDIEFQLQSMENKAKPLILQLKHLEEAAVKLHKHIVRLEDVEKRMRDNLFEIERELLNSMHSTAKYSDSARLNGIPQRFLTKFLKVRLKDLLEHESELHRIKYIELQKRRAEYRDLEREIRFTTRELIPLTTGLISDVKRNRIARLRAMVFQRRDSGIKIQALWRRSLVRWAFWDKYKEYWISKLDRDVSDDPFYYNLQTKEIRWEKPLAYWFFGNRYEEW